MADYLRPSTGKGKAGASSRENAPNFSRPRPTSSSTVKQDRSSQGHVHTLNAFHDANRNLPNEPTFSDSDEAEVTTSERSGSDAAWDGHTGELSTSRKKKYDDQRYSRKPNRPATGRPTTSRSTGSENTVQTFNLEVTSTDDSSSASGPAARMPVIMKRVSVDQRSERVSTSTAGEDARSHHTVSEEGESGSYDMEGRWTSASEYVDTSSLSAAEIRKLEKKGISPALYLEMKGAKKGKKWVGPLFGNTFLG